MKLKPFSFLSFQTRTKLLSAILLAFFVSSPIFAAQSANIPEDIKEAIRERVESGYNAGIIVGIIDANGACYYSDGKTILSGNQNPNKDTVFEIGSFTKVFTSLLLADMVQQGQIALEDPIEKFLPPSVQTPKRNGKSITLANLATHTSGLPRLPDNLLPSDANNPYADYSVEQMYEFLSGYELQHDIGVQYEYSNYGGGLLGHLLALQSGMSYEELFVQRIANELGILNTRITLTPAMTSSLAKGHTGNIEVSNWDIPTLAGAGAMRSTAQDMLTFLAVNMGLKKSRLYPAMKVTHKQQHQAGSPDMHIGLGWHIRTSDKNRIIWHNGGTGGYWSFAGFIEADKTGVVVLTNTSQSIDDIGYHLLDPNIPLQKFEVQTKLDATVLKTYVGKYEIAPGAVFDIALQNGQLTSQLTGQQRFPIYAKSQTEFFYKVVDAQITFVKDKRGEITALVLHQFGIDQTARKLGAEYQPPTPRTEVTVKPEILGSYVGKYELAPKVLFDIRLQKEQLTAQLTGQQRLPIYAESQTKFFCKVVDAQITFVKDKHGKVTALVLHQFGLDQNAKKIE
jgi:CubicO group peptidase (beta-lactamase class C family)